MRKISYINIKNFFCFVCIFTVIIDPTNTLLGIKDISFILFAIATFTSANYKNILIPLTFLCIICISTIIGLILPNAPIDFNILCSLYKSFFYLIIICLFGKSCKSPVFKYFFIANGFLAFLCVILDFYLLFFPEKERIIYSFFIRNNLSNTIFYTKRHFLGITFFGIFHKTAATATICLGYSLYRFLFNSKKKYVFYSILFSCYLFFSSTRANIVAAIGIPLFCYIYYLYKKKKALTSSIFLAVVSISIFSIVILLLLAEKTDHSVNIKTLHKISYDILFSSTPIRYTLVGDGPGSLFFSYALGNYTSLTELTFFELIRNFGLLFTTFLLVLFIYPFIEIRNKKSKVFFIFILISYLFYLFISMTNPYLIGSSGFTVYAILFYISSHSLKKEFNVS